MKTGICEGISKYMYDLISCDKVRIEQQAFEQLHSELAHAFAAPESSYRSLSAADVIARNQRKS